jgi:DNA invertase Pin-like site-specific DNA recombinase
MQKEAASGQRLGRQSIKGEGMKAGIYARVSKDDGSQTTENQLLELRRFAESQTWTVYREYTDRESGAKSDRVEFQAMLKDASKRKFDVLLVWASDRLTREGAYQTLGYLKTLDNYGVRFRSYTESFLDTTGPVRDLLIAIAGWLGQQERAKLIARTRAGLARAVAQGQRLGRPKVAVDVARIASLRSSGASWSQIVKQTGVSMGTAQRAVASLPKNVSQTTSTNPIESTQEIPA